MGSSEVYLRDILWQLERISGLLESLVKSEERKRSPRGFIDELVARGYASGDTAKIQQGEAPAEGRT